MYRKITIPALECQCDRCGYRWVSAAKPEHCRSRACRSREWDGKKKPAPPEIKLPAPRKPGRPRSIAAIDVRPDGQGEEF